MKIVWLKNKKGITLVELLVTMCILMIVAAPLLSIFLSASKNNALSQEILDSASLLQKVMEEIKARPLFLDSEAVTELEAPLTDYNEYGTYDKYIIKYKIIREDGTLSSLNDTYGFSDYEGLSYDIEYIVDSGEVSLNGTNYGLYSGTDPLLYSLEIYENSGLYSYKFFNENISNLYSTTINTISGSEPIRVKIQYNNNCSDKFLLEVNLDGISEYRDVYIYKVDDKKDSAVLYNKGSKSFYQYDGIRSIQVGYSNVLYNIELIAQKNGTETSRLLSSVRK